VGQRGLTQTGRAVEENVIDGFSSGGSCFDENSQIVLYFYLSHVVSEMAGPKGPVRVVILWDGTTGNYAFNGHASDPRSS
jgi:hypothetical protein